MHVVALIPARKGSKRLPSKNKLTLKDKPLVKWTLDLALELSVIDAVIVSTDDQEILNLAAQTNALAPWLRPSKLSTDNASSVDVALHAVEWYEGQHTKVDALVLLQPTSPFRTPESVKSALEIFKTTGNSIVSVAPAKAYHTKTFIEENNLLHPIHEHNSTVKSASNKQYCPTGSIYIVCPKKLKKTRSFFSDPLSPLITFNKKEIIDIDTKLDFELAQKLA